MLQLHAFFYFQDMGQLLGKNGSHKAIDAEKKNGKEAENGSLPSAENSDSKQSEALLQIIQDISGAPIDSGAPLFVESQAISVILTEKAEKSTEPTSALNTTDNLEQMNSTSKTVESGNKTDMEETSKAEKEMTGQVEQVLTEKVSTDSIASTTTSKKSEDDAVAPSCAEPVGTSASQSVSESDSSSQHHVTIARANENTAVDEIDGRNVKDSNQTNLIAFTDSNLESGKPGLGSVDQAFETGKTALEDGKPSSTLPKGKAQQEVEGTSAKYQTKLASTATLDSESDKPVQECEKPVLETSKTDLETGKATPKETNEKDSLEELDGTAVKDTNHRRLASPAAPESAASCKPVSECDKSVLEFGKTDLETGRASSKQTNEDQFNGTAVEDLNLTSYESESGKSAPELGPQVLKSSEPVLETSKTHLETEKTSSEPSKPEPKKDAVSTYHGFESSQSGSESGNESNILPTNFETTKSSSKLGKSDESTGKSVLKVSKSDLIADEDTDETSLFPEELARSDTVGDVFKEVNKELSSIKKSRSRSDIIVHHKLEKSGSRSKFLEDVKLKKKGAEEEKAKILVLEAEEKEKKQIEEKKRKEEERQREEEDRKRKEEEALERRKSLAEEKPKKMDEIFAPIRDAPSVYIDPNFDPNHREIKGMSEDVRLKKSAADKTKKEEEPKKKKNEMYSMPAKPATFQKPKPKPEPVVIEEPPPKEPTPPPLEVIKLPTPPPEIRIPTPEPVQISIPAPKSPTARRITPGAHCI